MSSHKLCLLEIKFEEFCECKTLANMLVLCRNAMLYTCNLECFAKLTSLAHLHYSICLLLMNQFPSRPMCMCTPPPTMEQIQI